MLKFNYNILLNMKDKEASVEDVDLNILGVLSENSRENFIRSLKN